MQNSNDKKWQFVNSEAYYDFINKFKEKGFLTKELESIHSNEYDFHTYINHESQRMINIAYCNPAEFDNNYQINLGLSHLIN